MRLGLIIYGSLDTLSGGYLYDRMLVRHLLANGDQVEIVSLPWRQYLANIGDNFSAALYKRLQCLQVDALLQDELNHPSLGRINRLLNGVVHYPIVSIVHHLRCNEARPAWQNRLYAHVERHYLTSVEAFIFNSQTTRRSVIELAGEGKPAVVAYPAGDRLCPMLSDEEIITRAGEPGPLRIFFLGNLIPRKGLHVLLQALALLPSETWKLAVAGSLEMDQAYTAAIVRQVHSAGLGHQVRFLGPLQEADLVRQFIQNQVMALPSSYEGFGIAYLEGMGFGLPAIASTRGAAQEIITHGKNGFLVPPNGSQELARCLLQLSGDRSLLARMSLDARQRFLAHPTWEQTMERIRDFLLEITSRGNS
jgi:glycosyltransferase involved in cell wall biosynthesis